MSDTSTVTESDTANATSTEADVNEPAVEEIGAVSGTTDVIAAITGLNNPDSAFYSSIKGGDFATRIKLTKAMTNSTPVDEILGKQINLKDVIVLPVDLADNAGEVNTAPRVILIDKDGTAYHATSIGLLTAIRNLFATLGEPAGWPDALPIKIVKEQGRNGFKFFTINLV